MLDLLLNVLPVLWLLATAVLAVTLTVVIGLQRVWFALHAVLRRPRQRVERPVARTPQLVR